MGLSCFYKTLSKQGSAGETEPTISSYGDVVSHVLYTHPVSLLWANRERQTWTLQEVGREQGGGSSQVPKGIFYACGPPLPILPTSIYQASPRCHAFGSLSPQGPAARQVGQATPLTLLPWGSGKLVSQRHLLTLQADYSSACGAAPQGGRWTPGELGPARQQKNTEEAAARRRGEVATVARSQKPGAAPAKTSDKADQ